MPTLHIVKSTEVPAPTTASQREQRRRRLLFDDFIRRVTSGEVGELELGHGETLRSLKVRLRQASVRLGVPIDVWDAFGRVYFRRVDQVGKRLSRVAPPRKA
jgi:hypothetical protein